MVGRRLTRPALAGALLLGLLLPVAGVTINRRVIVAPNITSAIATLAAQTGKGRLCVTVASKVEGRLSQGVKMVNRVLDFALANNVNFSWPQEYNTTNVHTNVTDVFGTGPVCEPRSVLVFQPVCVPVTGVRCVIEQMRLDVRHGHRATSRICDCDRVVPINLTTMTWNADYTRTYSVVRDRYWRVPRGWPALNGSRRETPPFLLAMHVRLDDVVRGSCADGIDAFNCAKHLNYNAYLRTLDAIAGALPPSCLRLNIVTDGHQNSPDIQQVVQHADALGFERPRVWTPHEQGTTEAFEFLVAADVMTYGFSGFAQLASMLSKGGQVHIGVPVPTRWADCFKPPMPNTLQLQWEHDRNLTFDTARAVEQLRALPRLGEMAQRCGAAAAPAGG